MKKLLLFLPLMVSCTTSSESNRELPEFDWMPSSLQWENNIRDCRSQHSAILQIYLIELVILIQ